MTSVPPTLRFISGSPPSEFWAMAVLALLVDIPVFAVGRRGEPPVGTTMSVCFAFGIFLAWGLAPAIVVQALAAGLKATGQRRGLLGGGFLVARLVVALAACEILVHLAIHRPIMTPLGELNAHDFLIFMPLAAVRFAVNFGLLLAMGATSVARRTVLRPRRDPRGGGAGAELEREGFRLRVAVNVSVQDMHDPEFPEEISNALDRYEIEPDQLTVEITERMLIEDAERVAHAAERVRELGVGLSLDDFGTGHASMQELRALPLTEVKIDKSYVSEVSASAPMRAVVTSIHQLGNAMGLSIVAEDVEDEDTAAALATLPGTIGQGWHFGKPVPADVFAERWHVR